MKHHSFSIESLGCSKNQVDSEILISFLEDRGLCYAGRHACSDIIIVNTCGFIHSAREESINTVLALKKDFPATPIVLTGCLASLHEEELRSSLVEADAVVRPENLEEISGIVEKLLGLTVRPSAAGKDQNTRQRRRLLSFPGSVYIKIADGCDNRCSYCSIPLIRGALKSRKTVDIAAEIRDFLRRGIVEFNLVAQDLGSFGLERGARALPALLKSIAAIPGDFWIRLLYIHPDHFLIEILDIMKDDPRFLPYFDIPFQHSSQRILSAMGRRGNAAVYLELIRKIRQALPDPVLRSTFLTGFPGEDRRDFRELLAFQREADLDWAGFFTYSREEGTPAFGMKLQVGAGTAFGRKKELEVAQTEITGRRLARFVGRNLDVLVEEGVGNEALWLGRSYAQAPEADGLVVVNGNNLTPGRKYTVRITRQNGFDLEGVPA